MQLLGQYKLLTLKVLNSWKLTYKCGGWISDTHWSLKTLTVGHGGSSAGLYLADSTSPIYSHCSVIILFKSVPAHKLSWLALLRVEEYLASLCFLPVASEAPRDSRWSFFFQCVVWKCVVFLFDVQCYVRHKIVKPTDLADKISYARMCVITSCATVSMW